MKLQIILTLDAANADVVHMRTTHGQGNDADYARMPLARAFREIEQKVIPEAREELQKSLSQRPAELPPR